MGAQTNNLSVCISREKKRQREQSFTSTVQGLFLGFAAEVMEKSVPFRWAQPKVPQSNSTFNLWVFVIFLQTIFSLDRVFVANFILTFSQPPSTFPNKDLIPLP